MIRCLYLDDEAGFLEITKEFLEANDDIKVVTYDTPRNAERALSQHAFDVIISDYQMPEMDGIEFYRKVRDKGHYAPFVLFTGRGREEVAINALNAGIDFYLKKGGDPRSQFTELENVVRHLSRMNEAESALSYNSRKFRHIIENIMDMVIIIDLDWNIQYCSPSVTGSLGYLPEEMTGTKATKYLHQDDAQATSIMGMMVESGPSDKAFEFRLLAKDGTFKWFEGKGRPMPLEFGEGLFIMSAWLIDERKRMEKEIRDREKALVALFDISKEYVLITSLDGRIRAVNQMFADTQGKDKNDVIGRNIFEFIAPSSLPMVKERLERRVMGENSVSHYVVSILEKDGRSKEISISTKLVNNEGEEPYVVVTGADSS